MYYCVYKITNKFNNKVYIGAHRTTDLNDNYTGSGKLIKSAIEKYGLENFHKKILKEFNSEKEMFEYEKLIVNKNFVNSKNTYNIAIGGKGSWDYANSTISPELRSEISKKGANKLKQLLKNNEFNKEFRKSISIGLKNSEKRKNYFKSDKFKEHKNKFSSNGCCAALSEKSNKKRIKTFKIINHQQGDKNSNYGKSWYYNLELKQSKPFLPDEVPYGWIKGRKIKF